MSASYPSGVVSFSVKAPGDTVASAHVDALQDEIIAVEGGLVNGVAHVLKPDGDVTRTLGVDAARWAHPAGVVGAPGIAFTGDGDTGIYHSGANALELATAGVKALGIDSTQFIDSPTQPRAKASKSGNQSIADSTLTAVLFNTESFDVGALHNTGSNTDRLTVPTGGDGLYLIIGQMEYASNATGVRMARINLNNSSVLATVFVNANAADVTDLNVIAITPLVATDFVNLIAYQTSTGALNVSNGCTLSMVKLW